MAAPQKARTTTTTTRSRAPQKEKPQTKGRAAPARRPAAKKSTEKAHRTVSVPLVAPHFTVHKVDVPAPTLPVSGDDMVTAGKTVTSFIRPPGRLVYYAGLGALAAFGVVEWPVAAAIGVGVAVAKRARRSDEQRHEQTGRRQ
ncbi:hypothetical protein AB0C21_05045 [Spirillospora sp. NPDC049024]